jgi:hypothetical protein
LVAAGILVNRVGVALLAAEGGKNIIFETQAKCILALNHREVEDSNLDLTSAI